MIAALFHFASQTLPAVIYIRDIDVLFSENEEMTGFTNRILFILATHKSRFETDTRIGDFMIIAGSACPLNKLSPCVAKVFQKSIQIDLPTAEVRTALLKKFIANSKH